MSIHRVKKSLKNADVRYVGGLILTLAKRCTRTKVQRAKGVKYGKNSVVYIEQEAEEKSSADLSPSAIPKKKPRLHHARCYYYCYNITVFYFFILFYLCIFISKFYFS